MNKEKFRPKPGSQDDPLANPSDYNGRERVKEYNEPAPADMPSTAPELRTKTPYGKVRNQSGELIAGDEDDE